MDNQEKKDKALLSAISRLLNLVVVLLIIVIGLIILLYTNYVPSKEVKVLPYQNGDFTGAAKQDVLIPVDTVNYWQAPDLAMLEGHKNKDLILYGKDIIANTAYYFGPNGKISKSSTNGMNCKNCHLDAGTKVFGINYSAVASTYPKLRARSGTIEDMYKRVNDCFERSLNGKALETTSKEMQGIVAYIKWLGKDVPKGTSPQGSGFKEMAFLDRAASPENGKSIYAQKCASCHHANGLGLMNDDKIAYTYPPLWGEHSYNDGAGLFRMSNFARYIKYNMPLGANHNSPQLRDEEAWDIAAFVNSQTRPHNKNKKKDWPKIEEKPFDYPFGPYADGFNEKQHKYGPYTPIKEKLEAMKKTKK